MKLSSRKQLLYEADDELNKIRLRILFEQTGGDLEDKLEKASKRIVDSHNKKKHEELENDLKKLKIKMQTQQEKYEEEKRNNPDLTIEEWYSKQSTWVKSIYAYERAYKKMFTGTLWQRIYVGLAWLLSVLPSGMAFRDKDGNYYDPETGKQITKDEFENRGVSSDKSSLIRNLMQSL